ncbi:hypothetical protein DS2_10497 [Catenovulum agarivorans DS-2]|uniref:Uncharacterized protein n=1 Tax=Catenovulum agarivorans DS-2 TaxID=1328313 RepID=W7QAM5_9ALTE|nr:hypothetical protein [Catenovulum agarivorans]EWH09869.1 hypothetical protein DS2_10497 [Catenovulum agarivorans DS-2]
MKVDYEFEEIGHFVRLNLDSDTFNGTLLVQYGIYDEATIKGLSCQGLTISLLRPLIKFLAQRGIKTIHYERRKHGKTIKKSQSIEFFIKRFKKIGS